MGSEVLSGYMEHEEDKIKWLPGSGGYWVVLHHCHYHHCSKSLTHTKGSDDKTSSKTTAVR